MAEEESGSPPPSPEQQPKTGDDSADPCQKKVHHPQCYYIHAGFQGLASGYRATPAGWPPAELTGEECATLDLDNSASEESDRETGPPDFKNCAMALLVLVPPLGVLALVYTLQMRRAYRNGQFQTAWYKSRRSHLAVLYALACLSLVFLCLIICVLVLLTYKPPVAEATTTVEPVMTTTYKYSVQADTPPGPLMAIISNFMPMNYSKAVPPVKPIHGQSG